LKNSVEVICPGNTGGGTNSRTTRFGSESRCILAAVFVQASRTSATFGKNLFSEAKPVRGSVTDSTTAAGYSLRTAATAET